LVFTPPGLGVFLGIEPLDSESDLHLPASRN
jgi:hypothetical protein